MTLIKLIILNIMNQLKTLKLKLQKNKAKKNLMRCLMKFKVEFLQTKSRVVAQILFKINQWVVPLNSKNFFKNQMNRFFNGKKIITTMLG